MIFRFLTSGLPFLVILAMILAYALAMLIAFSMHEYAHALASYKLGDTTPKALGRLTINPFKHIDPSGFICLLLFGFGWGKPVQVNPLNYKSYKKGMAIVSLSGVLTNLILAFVFSGLYFFIDPLIVASNNLLLIFVDNFLYCGIILNLSLFVFNLLPIFPLDGFNFLSALLSDDNKFVNFMRRYGSLILFIFIVTPIFDYVFTFVTNGILKLFTMFWRLFV